MKLNLICFDDETKPDYVMMALISKNNVSAVLVLMFSGHNYSIRTIFSYAVLPLQFSPPSELHEAVITPLEIQDNVKLH